MLNQLSPILVLGGILAFYTARDAYRYYKKDNK